MRVAVFADIHGNLAALEAVLHEIERLKPDRCFILGDIIDGAPDSIACWHRVEELGYPMLRGNHERYVFDYGTPRASPEWSAPHFAPIRWAVNQCPPAVREQMAALPMTLRDPELPELLFVHASSRSDQDSIFIHTPDTHIDPMFPGVREPLIIRGHNHLPGTRSWGARSIVNLGAVGLPLDGHLSAQFALLEKHQDGWHARHLAVPYDVDATIRRFRESGYLEAGGPMARLFLREVATATHHFVPFLRHYGHAIREQRIDLNDAINRFLSEY
jgi:predicted phosphodiesterase